MGSERDPDVDFSDLLDKTPEQLADITETDWIDIDDHVSRGSTVAQLRMWLTDNEVQLPSAPVKKLDYVVLAVQTLTDKRSLVIKERERAAAAAAKSPQKRASSARRRSTVTPRKRKLPLNGAEVVSTGKSTPVPEKSALKKRSKSNARKSLSIDPMINPSFLTSLAEGESVVIERSSSTAPVSPVESRSVVSQPPGTPVNDGRPELVYQSPVLAISDRNPFQSGSGKKSKKESVRAESGSAARSRRDLAQSPFRVLPSSVTRQQSRSSSQGGSTKQYHSALSSSPLTPTLSKPAVEPRNLFTIGGAGAPRRIVRQTVVVPTAPPRPSLWRYFLLSTVVVAFVVLVAVLIPRLRETITYCPSNPADPALSGCVPCPARALCDRAGKAHCFEGLVLQNHRCVDDPEVMLLAEDMYDDVNSVCSRHLGQVLCDDRGDPFLSLHDVERNLFQLYGRQVRYKDALRKTMELVRLNTTSSLHYANDPARVWSTQPKRPFACGVRHWCLEHAPMLTAFVLVMVSSSILVIRQRRRALRLKRAVLIFKEALNILKTSEGPVALDHLSATAFEHCSLDSDAQVWNLALDQLSRDSRINNAITFRNGVQKKGMLFSQIPMRTTDNKPIHLYPSVEQY